MCVSSPATWHQTGWIYPKGRSLPPALWQAAGNASSKEPAGASWPHMRCYWKTKGYPFSSPPPMSDLNLSSLCPECRVNSEVCPFTTLSWVWFSGGLGLGLKLQNVVLSLSLNLRHCFGGAVFPQILLCPSLRLATALYLQSTLYSQGQEIIVLI